MAKTADFQALSGGLQIAVLPQCEGDIVHQCTLGGILSDALQYEARTHGAVFHPEKLHKVVQAMSCGEVEILFFAAAWNVCSPTIAGATVNQPTLFLQRNGANIDVHRGIYSEDVCLLPSAIRKIIAERPRIKKLPDEGLGLSFVQASIDHYAALGFKDGAIPVGQVFEYAPSNTSIIAVQNKLGAQLGDDTKSALFEVDSVHDLEDRFKVPVSVHYVCRADGTIDPNNFVVSWQSETGWQKITAAFTKGLSTYRGEPVAQAQFISNGCLPPSGVIESVALSILQKAEQVMEDMHWAGAPESATSPIIPCGASARDIYTALFDAQNIVLLKPRRPRALIGKALPMRIHVFQEPEIAAAIKAIGGTQRVLGSRPMQTATLDLRKAAALHNGPPRPLSLIAPDAARHDPIFSLAV